MTTIKIELNKLRDIADGSHPLIMRVIHERKIKKISTPYALTVEELDESAGRAVFCGNTSREQIQDINDFLYREVLELEYVISCLKMRKKEFKVLDIIRFYYLNKKRSLFKPYMERVIDDMRSEKKESEADFYLIILRRISCFQSAKSPLTFNDINKLWISNWSEYLLESGLSDNSVRSYRSILCRILKRAQKEGLYLDMSDPFSNDPEKNVAEIKYAVDEHTIKKLSEISPEDTQLSFSRDLFLFSHGTEMSFLDMAYLKEENVHEDIIWYHRNVDRQLVCQKLTPFLYSIVRKYINGDEYVFSFLRKKNSDWRNHYYNEIRHYNSQLKALMALLNISCE